MCMKQAHLSIIIWNNLSHVCDGKRYRNGMKSRNSWKIVEMSHQGNNILGFWFNSNQKWIKICELDCLFGRKIWHRIEPVNSMYDHESPKVKKRTI